jgi:hypothetical protein
MNETAARVVDIIQSAERSDRQCFAAPPPVADLADPDQEDPHGSNTPARPSRVQIDLA